MWAGNIHDLIVSGTATVDETIGCRDDIMIYLIGLGMEPSLAFQTMESVRKGKVKKSGKFPGDAEQQMKDLGVPDWWVESARKIAYLFPKAHAVAYVMMAFRIAWFKVHEPLAFYSAYFYRRSQKGGFDIEMMGGGTERVRRKINEMKRDAIRFLITDNRTILPPFVSVPGLGETAAWDLAHCRESGREFISIDEIGSACPKVSQTHLETLKRMGAFGDLPDSSQVSLFDDW